MSSFSTELDHILRERMATGLYQSEDDVILQGVRLLAERDDTVAALKRGIESMERGEGIPLEEAFDEIRRRKNIAPQS